MVRGLGHGTFSHDLRGESILPFLGEVIDFPVEFPHGDRFGVHDVSLDFLEFLVLGIEFSELGERFLEDFVDSGFPAVGLPDQHDPESDLKSLEEFHDLLDLGVHFV
jgi:hypothetical protein